MRVRSFVLVAVWLLIVGAAAAQQNFTFEKFQVADTAVGLNEATLHPSGGAPMLACEGRLETAQVRYRFDGGTVGSTTGILLDVGDVLSIPRTESAALLRMVKTGSTTAVFQVSCWR